MRDVKRWSQRRPQASSTSKRWLAWGGLALAALALLMLRPTAGSRTDTGTFEGPARVIDGDSLQVGGREIRLHGIDAPEGRQSCTRDGVEYARGEDARRHLSQLIGGRTVTCRGVRADQYARLLGSCEAAGRSLNAEMVESGHALAFGGYAGEEERARSARRGMWSGEFQRPGEWRAEHSRH